MKLKITVDQKTYEVDVEVEEERVATIAPRPERPIPVPAAPQPFKGGESVCRSPLAGVVARVNTHPGQHVQQNDPLLVLEAMKMETNVTSPVTGTVRSVNVDVGDAVQAGQVLVEFQ